MKISAILGVGAGGTWPGEIALTLCPNILSYFFTNVEKGIILVAGTNGKTTTSKMIQNILSNEKSKGKNTIVHNETGANLINGLVSAFIQKWNFGKSFDWAVLEVDEAALPSVVTQISSYNGKIILVLLNLFRDQLDRYGEVRTIAKKWKDAMTLLPNQTQLIVNADDPELVAMSREKNSLYFGINDSEKFLKIKEHATDSTYCSVCGNRLTYEGIFFSHLGIWKCTKCGNSRPKLTLDQFPSPLPGLYNRYNTLAAVLAGKLLGKKTQEMSDSLKNFLPAFGRQEELTKDGKRVKFFLAKNPAGYNATLRTLLELGARHIVFLLNDRIPDGRDVSWIWDVDFEMLPANIVAIVSGDRVYDLAIRMKYAQQINTSAPKILTYEKTKDALEYGLGNIERDETLYVLPTYSAMLEAREILTGRKIL